VIDSTVLGVIRW